MTNHQTLARYSILALFLLASPVSADPVVPPAGPEAGTSASGGKMREAMGATVGGDLEGGKRLFEAMNKASPSDAGLYIGLAEVAARANDIAGAEAQLRRGIAANPGAIELRRALGRLMALQGKLAEAVAEFDVAIRLKPDQASSYLEIAELLNQRFSQPARALPYYDRVLARDGASGAAHYGRGLALARTGKQQEALTALREAARLLPKDPLPDFSTAVVLVQLNRRADALAAYGAALMRAPEFVQARVARASLLLNLNRPDQAKSEFTLVLQQQPGNLGALMGLAMAHQMSGDVAASEAGYRAVLAIDPAQVVAMNNLAAISADSRRDLDAALVLARQVVERYPTVPAFLDTLGWVHFQRGDLDAAELQLARAVELQPTSASLTRLGVVRAALGRRAAAATVFRRALLLSPDYGPAREELARLR